MSGMTAHQAGYVAGTIVATVVLLVGPIVIGVLVSRRLNRNRDYSNSVRWPTYIGVAISALVLLGQCAGTRSNGQSLEINHG